MEYIDQRNETIAQLKAENELLKAKAESMEMVYRERHEQLTAKLKSMEDCYSRVKDRVESFNNEDGVKALKEENATLKHRLKYANDSTVILQEKVASLEVQVKEVKEEVRSVKYNGDNEKVYLGGRIKQLLHQVSSLSGILADVSGKHADRINTGITTPVHLMNQ
jgi:predicted  nucleic acid-binding Zn-ribbon protein